MSPPLSLYPLCTVPILPLWTLIIFSRTGDEEETKASNAIAENWFKIVKHPIFESNIHIRPGDFIRTMYSNIHDRISAFKFGFHPLASRIFKAAFLNRVPVAPLGGHEAFAGGHERDFDFFAYPSSVENKIIERKIR